MDHDLDNGIRRDNLVFQSCRLLEVERGRKIVERRKMMGGAAIEEEDEDTKDR
uniref:Uncharacterized protein n=1 Tax=Oryza brachyantha TaxID=4533 RepID=J3LR14_ORYBR